jgi:flagellar basal body-associated protein FliL
LNEPITEDTILVIRGLLQKYHANQGVLISNGICSERAVEEAVNRSATVSPVHIMDKEIILNILFEGTKAVKSRRIEVYLKNDDFFEEIRMRASRVKDGIRES